MGYAQIALVWWIFSPSVFSVRTRLVIGGVFSLTGGMGPQTQAVVRRLGEMLAEQEMKPKSVIMGWLRVRLSFTILRSVITCLCGSRSRRSKASDGDEAHIARERSGGVS